MVFKVVSGAPTNVYIYQLWSSADTLNENKTEALNANSSFKAHYKNRLVQNWQTANPKEVGLTPWHFLWSHHFAIRFVVVDVVVVVVYMQGGSKSFQRRVAVSKHFVYYFILVPGFFYREVVNFILVKVIYKCHNFLSVIVVIFNLNVLIYIFWVD